MKAQKPQEMALDLKGNVIALEAVIVAMLRILGPTLGGPLRDAIESEAQVARATMVERPVPDLLLQSFDTNLRRYLSTLP